MRLRLRCPACDGWTRTDQLEAAQWTCQACAATIPGAPSPGKPEELNACRRCGNAELYVQKDFPHWLGMGILVVACIASIITYQMYWIMATWIILIGSAVLDGLLYLIMGSVTVCYRCQTHHCGFRPNLAHQGFELTIGERYRQERLRRQQLEKP